MSVYRREVVATLKACTEQTPRGHITDLEDEEDPEGIEADWRTKS